MHPILFTIGEFRVPAYGVVMVGVFLLCWKLLQREAKRQDLDPLRIGDAAIAALLFGLLGAKVLLIAVEADRYLTDPRALLSTLQSAGVIYGGQIGGALGLIWYLKRAGLPLRESFDLFAPFFALGMGLGRLSCLMAGCCYGAPYEGLFALHFPDHPLCDAPPHIGLFPVQIVDLAFGLILFAFLLHRLRNRQFPGQIFFLFVIIYGVGRGLIEFLRGDSIRGMWFGNAISTSQIVAILAVILGFYAYFRLKRMHAERKVSDR